MTENKQEITNYAKNPKNGMTLGEMRDFVISACEAGAPFDTKIISTANWRMGIKDLTIKWATQGKSNDEG